jgi:CRP-like cAMP-binding protein
MREDATVDAGTRVQRSLFARTLFGQPEMNHAVESVAAVIRDVHFDEGTVIYREGGTSTHIYFILEGQVALETPGEPTWTFGTRDGFGFQDAMRDRPHARTAVALSDVHALALAVDDWLDLLEDHSELARGSIVRHVESVGQMIAKLAPDGGFPDPGEADALGDARPRPNLVERIVMLSESALFARAGIEAIARLARFAKPETALAGEVIIRPGEGGGELLLIGAGIVALERAEPMLRARFGAGSLAGGLAMVGRSVSDFTLTAETPAVVLRIPDDDWFEAIDDHFDLARAVFAHMAGERENFMKILAMRAQPSR